jgi:hypothetical protein
MICVLPRHRLRTKPGPARLRLRTKPGPARPAAAGQDRDRLRSPLVPAQRSHAMAPRRRPDRGRPGIARALAGSGHVVGLRAPHGRRHAGGLEKAAGSPGRKCRGERRLDYTGRPVPLAAAPHRHAERKEDHRGRVRRGAWPSASCVWTATTTSPPAGTTSATRSAR